MSQHFDPNSTDAVLARIETQTRQIAEQITALFDKSKEQERRVSALEKWQHWCLGAAAIVGYGLSVVVEFFKRK
jgi:hypothetical protein